MYRDHIDMEFCNYSILFLKHLSNVHSIPSGGRKLDDSQLIFGKAVLAIISTILMHWSESRKILHINVVNSKWTGAYCI